MSKKQQPTQDFKDDVQTSNSLVSASE